MTATARLARAEATTLSSWLSYSTPAERADEQSGESDGEREVPGAADAEYSFRDRVMTAALANWRAFQDEAEHVRTHLAHEVEELERDAGETHVAATRALENKRGRRVDRVERRLAPNSTLMTRLREREAHCRAREQNLETELGRPLRIHLRYLYLPIMALLALMEVPINRFAFELFFAETPTLSFAIAFGIGVGLMLLAHFGGMWAKRSVGPCSKGQRAAYLVGVTLTFALAAPTVALIASLRQHYIQFIQAQQITFAQLLEDTALSDVAAQALTTELGTEGWMLLFINLLVVGIGALASVLRHDAHPDYENVVRRGTALERRIARLERRRDQRLARVAAWHDRKSVGLASERDRALRRVAQAREEYDECDQRVADSRKRVALQVVRRVQAYEAGNIRSRRTPAPATFHATDAEKVERRFAEAFVRHRAHALDGPGVRAVS